MNLLIESIVKNILKESEEEYNFLKKVQSENPTLYNRFYSLVKNKGLDVAQEKYKEFDPEIIKQKEKDKKRLDKEISNIEKKSKYYSELKEFMDIVNYLRKNHSINKSLAEILKNEKPTKLIFNKYKTVDKIKPLYEKDPEKLKRYVDRNMMIPIESTIIYNKYSEYGDEFANTIKIDSSILPKDGDLIFNIKIDMGYDYMAKNIEDQILNKIREKWTGFSKNGIDDNILFKILGDFIHDFSKENLDNLKLKVLAKRN
jgi:hypothetical protein